MSESITVRRTLYTFGATHDLYLEALMGWLEVRMVTVVFDVRSSPYSLMREDLFPASLASLCEERKIAYHCIGHLIGDRPQTPVLYTDSGQRIDYKRYARMTTAQEGINRIEAAWRMGERVAILDRDSDLVNSHRGRFLGAWLEHLGVEVKHIDVFGNKIVSQEYIRRHLKWMGEPLHCSAKKKRTLGIG